MREKHRCKENKILDWWKAEQVVDKKYGTNPENTKFVFSKECRVIYFKKVWSSFNNAIRMGINQVKAQKEATGPKIQSKYSVR